MAEQEEGVCFYRSIAAMTAGFTGMVSYHKLRDREKDCYGPFENAYREAAKALMNYIKSFEDRTTELCSLIQERCQLQECILKKREEMSEERKKLTEELKNMQEKYKKVQEKNAEHKKMIKQAQNCLCQLSQSNKKSCDESEEDNCKQTVTLMKSIYEELKLAQIQTKQMFISHEAIMLECGLISEPFEEESNTQAKALDELVCKNDKLVKQLQEMNCEFQKLTKKRNDDKMCLTSKLKKAKREIENLTSENSELTQRLAKVERCHDVLCKELKRRMEMDRQVSDLKKIILTLACENEDANSAADDCCSQDCEDSE